MSSYNTITIDNVSGFIDNESSIIIDIRDEKSYTQGRIPKAIRFDENYIRRMRKTEQRHNPVLIYCYHGHSSRDVASMLCAFGFTDVYSLDGGFTAWNANKQQVGESSTALSVNDPETRSWLTSEGFYPDDINQRNEGGFTPLMQACRLGTTGTVKTLLDNGVDVNLTNNDGNNALWLACFSDDTAAIELLIESGIDINNQNVTGATSLVYASSAGKATVVKRLLEAGADPHIKTQDDFSALDLAASPQTYRLLRNL